MTLLSHRLVRLALGLSLAISSGALAATVTPASAEPAHAASSVGGQITRSEVLARAYEWLNRSPQLTYSQSTYVWDGNQSRRYRTDCSGMVDMAWHLNADPNTDALATSTFTTPIAKADLKPGDLLDDITGTDSHHAILFEAWAADHVHFSYLSFGHTPMTRYTGATFASGDGSGNLAGHPVGDYAAYRYRNIAPGDVYLTPNNATGNIAWGPTSLVYGSSGYVSIAASDLNNDAKRDLVGVNAAGDVYFTPNNATGTPSWGATSLIFGGSGYKAIAVGDLNNDDRNDLIGVKANGDVYFTPNNATGTITWGATSLIFGGAGYKAIAVGDLNNDSKRDLIGVKANGDVYFTPNNATGTITWGATSLVFGGAGYVSIAASDLNNDAMRDLVGVKANGDVYFTPNNAFGTITWGATSLIYGGAGYEAIAVGDLNNDSKDDLVGLR